MQRRARNYVGLTTIAVILRVFSLLVLAAGFYGCVKLIELELAIHDYDSWLRALLFLAGVIGVGLLSVVLWALADFIVLAIDVAESTRKTATILEQRNRRIDLPD